MVSSDPERGRSRFPNAVWMLVGAIMCISFSCVQALSQTEDPEARLRKRMGEYWAAMQNSDPTAASQYVHPDSRKTFAKVPPSRIVKWEIKSLGCNETLTTCDTVTIVTKPLAGIADVIGWEIRNQWVVEGGEWYFKIPFGENDNPLLEAFKQQAEVAKVIPKQEMAAPLENEGHVHAAPPVGALVGLQQRLVADPANPSVVHLGEKVTFRYSFTNTETKPIKITSAYSDCHCTGITNDGQEVLPGKSGTIAVTLDSFGLPLGPIAKDMEVRFSDSEAVITVPIRVSNVPNFIIEPATVDFGTVDSGQVEKSVRLRNESGRVVKILTRIKSDPRLEVSIPKLTLDSGEEIRLSFRYEPASSGEFLDSLMLQTDLPAQPLINIPVRGIAK